MMRRIRLAWFWLLAVIADAALYSREWLTDAWFYLTDRLRGRGCGTGLHVLPAGEIPDGVCPGCFGTPRGGGEKWCQQCIDESNADYPPEDFHVPRSGFLGKAALAAAMRSDLPPLPEYDEGIAIRERYRREAWAATGTTEAQFWAGEQAFDTLASYVAEFAATGNLPGQHSAGSTRDSRMGEENTLNALAGELVPGVGSGDGGNLPALETGPANSASRAHGAGGAVRQAQRGEPTNVTCGFWQPRELAPHVIRALTGARPDETVITQRDRQAWLDELCGGDPFDGKGSGDEYVDWLFAGLRVPA